MKPFPRLILIIIVVGGIAYGIKRANEQGFFAKLLGSIEQTATQNSPQTAPPAPSNEMQPAPAAPTPIEAPPSAAPPTSTTNNPGLDKLINSGTKK